MAYDANLAVIGGGAAGLVSSYIAAAVRAKVVLIEDHHMGGDCLTTGCVPSKALLRSAHLAHAMRNAGHYGLKNTLPAIDFKDTMKRVHEVITRISPHDSIERYQGLGVDCLKGRARLLTPHTIEVATLEGVKQISAANIIIATGAKPTVPPIPGLNSIAYRTSETIWGLKEQPGKLLVLGAGPIGCELAQAFARLGTEVTIVDLAPQVLPREAHTVAHEVENSLKRDGITLALGRTIKEFRAGQAQLDDNQRIDFDEVLIAIGRTANTAGLGLEDLGITLNPNKTISHNGLLQTTVPNIYVCGDVAGPYQFTHVAAHQAWYAAVNALFRPFKKFSADYRVIPSVTFTSPEVARVGLNVKEAKAQGLDFESTVFELAELDRAICDGDNHGFVEVLTKGKTDTIIGVSIVAEHAGEMLPELVLAMKHGIGLNKILGTIHAYPTWAEANKYVAGEWKRAHAPQWLLSMVAHFHRWRRS